MSSENQIEHSILEYLNSNGWFAWKNPTTGHHDGTSWRKQASPYSINGVSDIVAIKSGVVTFIEVKTPSGRQSGAQKAFEKKIGENGGVYLIVRSVNDIRRYIEKGNKRP